MQIYKLNSSLNMSLVWCQVEFYVHQLISLFVKKGCRQCVVKSQDASDVLKNSETLLMIRLAQCDSVSMGIHAARSMFRGDAPLIYAFQAIVRAGS